MGNYLNPSSINFFRAANSRIYVDKSELIVHTNAYVDTEQRFICVSRPRRFGKSMAANMLSAYYGRGSESDALFKNLKISKDPSYHEHFGKYDVIMINMQEFLSCSDSINEMFDAMQRRVIKELKAEYDSIDMDEKQLCWTIQDIFLYTKRPFIILIDEWDCIFREYKDDKDSQKKYLDFLRTLLKDQKGIGLAYMTGILPIKKYGSHSALNMFSEYSMTDPGEFAEYFGFTEEEVITLCDGYDMNYEEMRAWYDGYYLKSGDKEVSIYSPKSVVESIQRRNFGTYWNQTETYEALKIYVEMNIHGLKDSIIRMLAGGKENIDTNTFTNDMITFGCKDDVLTLLVHLGYLSYDSANKAVSVPNKEVGIEYVNSINSIGWNEVIRSIQESKDLLEALWNLDSKTVAKGIEKVHQEVSILQYNDENALSYTVTLAFYMAREYYTIIRELPSGKGFVDICLIPRRIHNDKPAMIIELKWDKNIKAAISQIKEKQYEGSLKEYKDNLLLVGINYDLRKKTHTCKIERYID